MNFSLSSLKNKVSALSLGKDENYLQSIVENINLQVPTYHSGVLIAYSSNYVASTALQKDIKFSWYRSGFKREELDLVDDSSNRPWYIPSADDIGFKMCVQCEDVFEKGFNRYRESTIIRADPLLCSTVEAAVTNCFYETNEVSIAFGNVLRPTHDFPPEAFDARQRQSALSNRACYFGCENPTRFRVEITEAGIMLCPAVVHEDGAPPGPVTYSTSGLLIKASSKGAFKVTCRYPVCCVISIPLTEETRSAWDPSGTAAAGGMHKPSKQLPWLWLGLDGSPLQTGFSKVLTALPHGVKNELHISVACADRPQRDAIALISRALCTSSAMGDAKTVNEKRLAGLPWTAVVVPTGDCPTSASSPPVPGAVGEDSSHLVAKIKQLELENSQLRKTKYQLALQKVDGTKSAPSGTEAETTSSTESAERATGSDADAMRKELQSLQEENEALANALTDAKKVWFSPLLLLMVLVLMLICC
jgi:hypothetical protein